MNAGSSRRICVFAHQEYVNKTKRKASQHAHVLKTLVSGASNGRGPRCAGWFADYITEKGDDSIQSLILEGGIKGWVKAEGKFTQNVDGYEPEYWKQFSEDAK